MKKIRTIFIFYFAIIFSSIIIQSCCNGSYHIVDAGEIRAYSIDSLSIREADTISGLFFLEEQFEVELASIDYPSLINSTMASIDCGYEFDNSIDLDKVNISCDKDFNFEQQNVIAGTDFSDIDGIRISASNYEEWSTLEIHFLEDFINNVEFENQHHTFTIKSQTTDGLDLEVQITLFIDL